MTSVEHADSGEPELASLAERAVILGEELGATQLEIKLTAGFTRSVEIKNNSTSGAQQQSRSNIGVRAYIGKKLGIATATLLNMPTLETTVAAAVKLAKLAPEDDDFNSLPFTDKKATPVEGIYDRALHELDPLDFLDFANSMIQGVMDTHDKAITGGKFDNYYSQDFVQNSLGITQYSHETALISYNSVSIPIEPTNVGTAFEFMGSRVWDKNFDFYQLGQKGGEKAKMTIDAKIADTGKLPILFDERATRNSMGAIIGTGVNGFSVMNKTSYFADKIGEELAVDNLKAWDDPHVKGGLSSTAHDAEGYPSQKITLLQDGILRSYVTDSYTAFKLGVENTGSAKTFGSMIKPKPGITQLQIAAGDGSKDQMLEDLREGILLESGVNPNAGSPEISSMINRGFYVKNGEIQYALKNTMVASNVFDFLKNISGISRELLFEFGQQSPFMLVDNMSISGQNQP